VRVLRFSRNFGHQIAITAGLDFASGNAAVVMDADLQDPPELIPELAARWREGYEVVYAVRAKREGETWFKRVTAAWFYRLLRRLSTVAVPLDAGDFRLIDRKALDAFCAMRENNRFVRGMFGWIGFRQGEVTYVRAERYAGRTKYPLRRMLRFATDAIISFSNAPLRIVLNFGFLVSLSSFLLGFAAIVVKLTNVYAVPGWASIVVVSTFLGGVQLVVLGIVGEYIARIYDEAKDRPLYLVMESRGFDGGERIPPRAAIGAAPSEF
jgi:polyisoprenyl-phosphate glycosyltransferase